MEVTIKVELGLSQELRTFIADAISGLKPIISPVLREGKEIPTQEEEAPEMEKKRHLLKLPRRPHHNWTLQEVRTAVSLYDQRVPLANISDHLNALYGFKPSEHAITRVVERRRSEVEPL